MTSNVSVDMVPKKIKYRQDLSMGHLHHKHAHYQLRYCRRHGGERFNDADQVIAKKRNKILYYKETVECRHVIFWPVRQGRVHCHTANLEPNQRVSIDEVPSLVHSVTF
jgi:hypothetical protein